MRSCVDPLALAVALAALVLAGPAWAEDAAPGGHAGASPADIVRQAGEEARRGDAPPSAHDTAGPTGAGHGTAGHDGATQPATGGDHAMAASDAAHAAAEPSGDGHDNGGEHAAAAGGHDASPAKTEADHGADHGADGSGHDAADAAHADADAAHGDGEHGEAAAHHEPVVVPKVGPQPYQVIRSLQFLQDQAARGNASANRVQAKLLQWYGPAFARASQKTWTDPRNQRAAALFVLSGGPPSVLRTILAKNDFPPDVKPMLDGALAYVENRQAEAEKLLSALDTETMEPGLAAQINLAIAQTMEKTAPDKALERLRRVMLDASGTLLEEAALRMGMVLAEQQGEHDRADGYARLYFDRYAASIYAGNFRARFTALYVERPFDQAEHTMATIEDAVARIPLAEQVNIYLSIGRRALVAGNMKLAGMAGAKVRDVPNLTKKAHERALLYLVASTLTQHDTAKTLVSLQSIDRESLHPADRKLYDAALGVLGEIRKPLMAGMESSPKNETGETIEASAESSVIDRANKLLDAVRNDLEGADK